MKNISTNGTSEEIPTKFDREKRSSAIDKAIGDPGFIRMFVHDGISDATIYGNVVEILSNIPRL